MANERSRFYADASRGEFLDALNGHAHQGSTVVLEGDAGSGISTLLGQAAMSLINDTDVELIRIDGEQPHEASLVVDALLMHFDVSREELPAALRENLANSRLVIIVDNAEELSAEALKTMGGLKQKLGTRLSYLFGGMPGTAEAVKGADLDVDDVLDLPSLSASQVQEFAQRIAGVLLDMEEAQELAVKSAGLPGPLLEALEEHDHIAVMGHQTDSRPLPVKHMAAAGGLVILILLLWLAMSGSDAEEQQAENSKAVPLPMPEPAATEPAPKPDEPQVKPLEPTMSPVARLEDLEQKPSEPSEESSPGEQAAASGTDEAPAPSETVAPDAQPQSDDTGYQGAQWLSSVADSRWFLQLMVTSREEGAHRVLDSIGRQGAYYRARRNGKVVYLVLAGDYASREAALSARAGLPKALRDAGPFPRQMADIRQEL